MSASSNCVTCGIITQLRARLAPEIFLMRDSGRDSNGPNFAKSTFGHGSRFSAPPPLMPPPPAAGPAPVIACLTKLCTSSCRMRLFGPVPVTRERSTPSSRANLRTDGDACAPLKASPSTGAVAGTGSAFGAAAGGGAGAAAGAAAGAVGAGFGASALAAAGAGFAAPTPSASSTTSIEPSLTLSPSLTRSSFTLPAAGDGTSIVALSDSSDTSESSAATVSPGLTKISMTGTSVKSPMSGTLTSIVLIASAVPPHTVHGAGFAGSSPYFFIASATFEGGSAPSSASAFSAATVT